MLKFSNLSSSIISAFFLAFIVACGTFDDASNTSISEISATDSIAKTSTPVKADSILALPVVPKTTVRISDLSKLSESHKIAQYKLRKYSHVTKLYQELAPSTIELCVQNKVPPAAILAIVSLESGWGSGYIGQITGNILSLNATKGNAQLPPLYLPVLKKDGKVLYDPVDIEKYTEDEFEYQNREPSLKKDYRPASIAGTTQDLAYFRYHPEERTKAQIRCINDFITRFVSHRSSIAAYREARTIMDNHVETTGIDALFSKQVNIEFINTIGGRPNSFNFRETWPKKVETILNGVGLVELTKEMYMDGKSFDEAW